MSREKSGPSSKYQNNSNNGEYARLTPAGCENEIKTSILAHFRLDLPLPSVDLELIKEIWVDQLLPPVSFEPFTAEEASLVAAGNMMSGMRRTASAGTSRGGAVAGKGGRGGNARYPGGDRDSSRSYDGTTPSTKTGTDRLPERSFQRGGGDREDDDEDVLWSMPQGDDSSFGTFDERGNFKMAGETDEPLTSRNGPKRSEEDSMRIPGHDRLPPPSQLGGGSSSWTGLAGSSLSGSPSLGGGLYSEKPVAGGEEETMWYYRDPMGQVQGPFSNRKMLHWYNRKYFPETLPLRREQDILFEPLTVWKIKLGGVCPFETVALVSAAEETVFSSPVVSLNSPKIPPPVDTNPPQPPRPQQPTSAFTANIFAQLGLPWKGPSSFGSSPTDPTLTAAGGQLVDEQVRFLQKFSGTAERNAPPKPTASIPSSSAAGLGGGNDLSSNLAKLGLSTAIPRGDPSTMASGGWKKMESTAALFDIESSLHHPPSPKSSVSRPQETLSSAVSNKPESPSGGSSSNDHPPAPKQMISLSNFAPATSPTVGWAKPAAPTKPLSEIMREEAEAEAARRASQPTFNSSAPKSFAETLRAAAAAASTSAPARSAPPVVVPRAVIPSAATQSSAVPLNKPSANPASPATLAPTTDLKSWCLAELKPLASTYDLNMCTILLMELKTPSEVSTFVEDNLRSNSMDMKAFTAKFLARRFGPSSIAASASSFQSKPAEPEFVTVGRKSRKPSAK